MTTTSDNAASPIPRRMVVTSTHGTFTSAAEVFSEADETALIGFVEDTAPNYLKVITDNGWVIVYSPHIVAVSLERPEAGAKVDDKS